MKKIALFLICNLLWIGLAMSQANYPAKVSADGRYLLKPDGKPFFWLGDTAWELFHRLNREEADRYLTDRAQKGFTLIQCVVLAELDGLNEPNPYGHKPLIDNDPTKPNEVYFKHVDYIINKAEKLGLAIGLLASWGDKWNKQWGVGPEIFTPENARAFGEFLGKRYADKPIVWIMGGDRDCVEEADYQVIRAMVEGIKKTDKGKHLFTFHPQGGKSSSDFFKEDAWVDFHTSQTGHFNSAPNHQFNTEHLAMTPRKPHLDSEPRYEDHPNAFNPGEKGWMDDFEARQAAYWNMLSGGCGHTYGNHNIWQMYQPGRKPISWARTTWQVALDQPGAFQVGYLRRLLESRPWHRLEPAQQAIEGDNPEGAEYKVAALSTDKDCLMVYIPYGRATRVNTALLPAKKLRGWWFNPRDGKSLPLGEFDNVGSQEFAPHSVGRGSDWVLVIDDAAKGYPQP